jgi:hypothetical protein
MSLQEEMYVAVGIAAFGSYAAATQLVRGGDWWLLPAFMFVLSPGGMIALRHFYEEGRMPVLLTQNRISKAFLGDALVLPWVFWFGGRGWDTMAPSLLFDSWLIWAVPMAVIGLVGAVKFNQQDRLRYINADRESSLKSPTKVWHDWVITPVFIGMLSWLLMPQLTDFSIDTLLSVVGLVIFGILAGWDFVYPPDPAAQHVLWSEDHFEPVDEPLHLV